MNPRQPLWRSFGKQFPTRFAGFSFGDSLVRLLCPGFFSSCPGFISHCPDLERLYPRFEIDCAEAKTFCPGFENDCPEFKNRCADRPSSCPGLVSDCPDVLLVCPGGLSFAPMLKATAPMLKATAPMLKATAPMFFEAASNLEAVAPQQFKPNSGFFAVLRGIGQARKLFSETSFGNQSGIGQSMSLLRSFVRFGFDLYKYVAPTALNHAPRSHETQPRCVIS